MSNMNGSHTDRWTCRRKPTQDSDMSKTTSNYDNYPRFALRNIFSTKALVGPNEISSLRPREGTKWTAYPLDLRWGLPRLSGTRFVTNFVVNWTRKISLYFGK